MIGYNYTYKSGNEVLGSITPLSEFSSTEIVILLGLLGFVGLCIFIIFPRVITYSLLKEKEKQRLSKKKLLKQILMQKEIEDEVEKEIHIQEEDIVVR